MATIVTEMRQLKMEVMKNEALTLDATIYTVSWLFLRSG